MKLRKWKVTGIGNTMSGMYWSPEMERGYSAGKPRKCTYCKINKKRSKWPSVIAFEAKICGAIPIPSSYVYQAGLAMGRTTNLREVQDGTIVGREYWVTIISEERCIKDNVFHYLLKRPRENSFLRMREDGSAQELFVPVPMTPMRLYIRKTEKKWPCSLTEKQLKSSRNLLDKMIFLCIIVCRRTL